MSAGSVFGANLIDASMTPLTLRTGAKSQSDPTAGGSTGGQLPSSYSRTITTADKAGAAILTIMMSALFVGTGWWLVT